MRKGGYSTIDSSHADLGERRHLSERNQEMRYRVRRSQDTSFLFLADKGQPRVVCRAPQKFEREFRFTILGHVAYHRATVLLLQK